MDIFSLDIGGSSIKRAVVNVNKHGAEIVQRLPAIELHSRTFTEVKNQVLAAVESHSKATRRKAVVAISTSGAVDRAGFVWTSGHFDGYRNVDWSVLLSSSLRKHVASVTVVNDGKASAWAEFQKIASKDEVFAHYVIGTGVGGALTCFGRLVYGDEDTAGALGHMKIAPGTDIVCSCQRRAGCVETVASAPAIARYYASSLRRDEKDSPVTFESTFLAAQSGDPRAVTAFRTAGEWLGLAIGNIINILNPRHITIGGGVALASMEIDVSDDGGPYISSAITRARETAFEDVAVGTDIRPATFGNDGGLLGAALLSAINTKHR
ncbi:ROK family protein [Maricaulis sp.]|uniref:ROK family protein n=1 Tax=Maricaulis sp. TaxID=1486257 RepID=UPI003299580A